MMPTKKEIARYWYEHAGEFDGKPEYQWLDLFLVDLGEPRCWGCGAWSDKNDISGWTVDEALKNFDNVDWLERCHVVPRFLGGSDEPSNLVLMCHRCNQVNPHGTDPEVFFRWMCGRLAARTSELRDSFEHVCRVLGITEKDIPRGINGLALIPRDASDFAKKIVFGELCAYEVCTGDTSLLRAEMKAEMFPGKNNFATRFGALYTTYKNNPGWNKGLVPLIEELRETDYFRPGWREKHYQEVTND